MTNIFGPIFDNLADNLVQKSFSTSKNITTSAIEVKTNIQSGDSPDDAFHKAVLKGAATMPLNKAYTETAFRPFYERIPSQIRSELEWAVKDCWNATKQLISSASSESAADFQESLVNIAKRPWRTVARFIDNPAEQVIINVSTDELGGGEAGLFASFATMVIGSAAVACGDEALSDLIDNYYTKAQDEVKVGEITAAFYLLRIAGEEITEFQSINRIIDKKIKHLFADIPEKSKALKKFELNQKILDFEHRYGIHDLRKIKSITEIPDRALFPHNTDELNVLEYIFDYLSNNARKIQEEVRVWGYYSKYKKFCKEHKDFISRKHKIDSILTDLKSVVEHCYI